MSMLKGIVQKQITTGWDLCSNENVQSLAYTTRLQADWFTCFHLCYTNTANWFIVVLSLLFASVLSTKTEMGWFIRLILLCSLWNVRRCLIACNTTKQFQFLLSPHPQRVICLIVWSNIVIYWNECSEYMHGFKMDRLKCILYTAR